MKRLPPNRVRPVRGHQAPIAVLLFLLFASCTSTPAVGPGTSYGRRSLTIVVNDFRFNPNTIRVRGLEPVTVILANRSLLLYNFTVKDPRGRIVVNVPIPFGQDTTIRIPFDRPGVYKFYCAIPFYADMGMTGTFTVRR